jgi:hypothetical protein
MDLDEKTRIEILESSNGDEGVKIYEYIKKGVHTNNYTRILRKVREGHSNINMIEGKNIIMTPLCYTVFLYRHEMYKNILEMSDINAPNDKSIDSFCKKKNITLHQDKIYYDQNNSPVYFFKPLEIVCIDKKKVELDEISYLIKLGATPHTTPYVFLALFDSNNKKYIQITTRSNNIFRRINVPKSTKCDFGCIYPCWEEKCYKRRTEKIVELLMYNGADLDDLPEGLWSSPEGLKECIGTINKVRVNLIKPTIEKLYVTAYFPKELCKIIAEYLFNTIKIE